MICSKRSTTSIITVVSILATLCIKYLSNILNQSLCFLDNNNIGYFKFSISQTFLIPNVVIVIVVNRYFVDSRANLTTRVTVITKLYQPSYAWLWFQSQQLDNNNRSGDPTGDLLTTVVCWLYDCATALLLLIFIAKF